jgi:hypothetical protein
MAPPYQIAAANRPPGLTSGLTSIGHFHRKLSKGIAQPARLTMVRRLRRLMNSHCSCVC